MVHNMKKKHSNMIRRPYFLLLLLLIQSTDLAHAIKGNGDKRVSNLPPPVSTTEGLPIDGSSLLPSYDSQVDQLRRLRDVHSSVKLRILQLDDPAYSSVEARMASIIKADPALFFQAIVSFVTILSFLATSILQATAPSPSSISTPHKSKSSSLFPFRSMLMTIIGSKFIDVFYRSKAPPAVSHPEQQQQQHSKGKSKSAQNKAVLTKARGDIAHIVNSTPSQQIAFSLLCLLYSGSRAPIVSLLAPLAVAEVPFLILTTALILLLIDEKSEIHKISWIASIFPSSPASTSSPTSTTSTSPSPSPSTLSPQSMPLLAITNYLNIVCASFETVILVKISLSELMMPRQDSGGLSMLWSLLRLVMVAQYVMRRASLILSSGKEMSSVLKGVEILYKQITTQVKASVESDVNANRGKKVKKLKKQKKEKERDEAAGNDKRVITRVRD